MSAVAVAEEEAEDPDVALPVAEAVVLEAPELVAEAVALARGRLGGSDGDGHIGDGGACAEL